MAYTSVTYTFSNSTTADATQVNQNFTDLVNGLSDGTKDISVNAITAAGTTTLNGNVNLGNSSSDDLTITAALAGSVSVKTNATYNVGSSTLGLLSIYLGATGSYTVRLTPSASQSATYTLTLPTTAGTKGYIPYNSDGSGTLTWEPNQKGVKSVSNADYTILDNDGFYSILVTTGASDRTITLPAAANNTSRKILIKKVDSGTGKVLISGTIDGSSTSGANDLFPQYSSLEIYSDGSSWYYIGKKSNAKTDGVAIVDYNVGYYTSSQVSGGTTTAADTWTDSTGSITLTPGVWMVGYNVTLDCISVDNLIQIYANVAIYNGTANIDESISFIFIPALLTTGNDISIPTSSQTVVNISASTTYSLRTRCSRPSTGTASDTQVSILGTSITGGLTNPDNSSKIWAYRIA